MTAPPGLIITVRIIIVLKGAIDLDCTSMSMPAQYLRDCKYAGRGHTKVQNVRTSNSLPCACPPYQLAVWVVRTLRRSDLDDIYIVMINHHGLSRKKPLCIDFVVREATGVNLVLENMSVYWDSIYIRANISGSRPGA
jgi:hypothetical protein